MDKNWLEVTVITSSEAVEAVTGLFYNVGVKSVSIEDYQDVVFKKNHPMFGDFFDEKVFTANEGAVVKGYFKECGEFDEYLSYIKEGIEGLKNFGIDKGEGLVIVNKVNEEDWENNWKKYYKPIKIGNKIVVKPLWEEYEKKEGEVIVELDPGMAFGTGTHETTRMCIKALEDYVKEDSIIFDIGTGSGILAIAASKLGAKEVIGVDLDPVAVEAAKKNISLNDLSSIKVLEGNLMEVVEGKADIVVANLLAEIVIELCEDVRQFIKKDGLFISSGIIREKEQLVIDKLVDSGFKIVDRIYDGEWCLIIAK